MLLCMIVNIETIAWRWCINELRAISFLLSVYSGQSNPDWDGNRHAEFRYDIQGGHSDMHLGHLGFEETGRQAITQHLLEAIDAIFGETTAMITDQLFSFGQAPRGDVRQCLGARVIGASHGTAFSCGGIATRAPRSATAAYTPRVSYAPSPSPLPSTGVSCPRSDSASRQRPHHRSTVPW